MMASVKYNAEVMTPESPRELAEMTNTFECGLMRLKTTDMVSVGLQQPADTCAVRLVPLGGSPQLL